MSIRTWESEEYHTFWKLSHFSYLDRVERRLLSRLVEHGDWHVDIGGGYGRLLDVYKDHYERCIITDYSMSMLQDANRHLVDNGIKNVYLIAADAHQLPFITNAFDSAMMVRLIHHIVNPRPVLNEVHRILRPHGSFIFEFQNKLNLNFRIKARLGLMNRKDLRSLEPFQAGPMYWNFHPKVMEQILEENFEQESILGGGVFWHRRVLTLLPKLEALDSWLAPLLGRHTLTHQLFLKLRAIKNQESPESRTNVGPREILAVLRCPVCEASALENAQDHLKCSNCGRIYGIQNGIYDFRSSRDLQI